MALEAEVVHYGQWGLFIAAYILGIFGVLTAVWGAWVLCYHWYCWMERRRDSEEALGRSRVEHEKQKMDLQLESLKQKQEMALEREKRNADLLNSELDRMNDGGQAVAERV